MPNVSHYATKFFGFYSYLESKLKSHVYTQLFAGSNLGDRHAEMDKTQPSPYLLYSVGVKTKAEPSV